MGLFSTTVPPPQPLYILPFLIMFFNLEKTSFALSLPGPTCYFKGRWNLDTWRDDARYLVFDDIPWDRFSDFNYPNKKDLLTANGSVGVGENFTLIDI